MIKRFLHFIQYHNAVNGLFLGLVLVGAGTAFAATDEGVRQVVIDTVIKETQTIVQIDNSMIVEIDLDTFDAQLQILEVEEDDFAYYAAYQFITVAIADGLWQEVIKKGTITIDKEVLAGGDLGLYLAEELGELTGQELRYLQEVQETERKKGSQKKKVATDYSGLIGKLLDAKEETFDGYELVVEKPEIVEQTEAHNDSGQEEPAEVTPQKEKPVPETEDREEESATTTTETVTIATTTATTATTTAQATTTESTATTTEEVATETATTTTSTATTTEEATQESQEQTTEDTNTSTPTEEATQEPETQTEEVLEEPDMEAPVEEVEEEEEVEESQEELLAEPEAVEEASEEA